MHRGINFEWKSLSIVGWGANGKLEQAERRQNFHLGRNVSSFMPRTYHLLLRQTKQQHGSDLLADCSALRE